jgi:deoxyuridine 5'-triphosphate nucleotidohydrolase
MPTLTIALLTATAQLPTRGTPGSAGYDLAADEDTNLWPGERRLISTGVSVAVPAGTYGRIAPRSGLAVKKGLDVMAGVIDPDYRGEVKVLAVNLGQTPIVIGQGDRIAQLVLERFEAAEVVQVETLDGTERGTGAFGSTGE